MKKLLTLLAILFIATTTTLAQGSIKGTVTDATTGETVIGATVLYAPGKGGVTDVSGNFVLDVPNGTYNVSVQFAGYQSENKEVKVDGNSVFISVQLKPNIIKGVEVFADIAISRQTPVAFSNIPAEKIKEQLGSQDLPMILNSTPGVYATQSGGGDGDARITIRGFSQRNIAVLVDGVPMNDMENGQVYWSNWFGLDNITRTLQVQRGLGASKLALPSVGGTMNVITSGFDAKRSLILKQEYGNNLNLRTILSYTSGQLKGGWAITAAGSYKRNDGWVDATYSKMWFYYFKVDKKLGNHMLTLTGFGAPQEHGQRTNRQAIGKYSNDLARDLGIDSTQLASQVNKEQGPRYNQNWGYLTRNFGADSLSAKQEKVNDKVNFFHKPVFSLKHSWQVNDKFYWSNIAYASFGTGGGTSLISTVSGNGLYDPNDGQIRFQLLYNSNVNGPINPTFGGKQSKHYLRTSFNNHNWYGLLSTFNYTPTKSWTISGGIDLRSYRAMHFQKVYDFLGGDYVIDNNDENSTQTAHKSGDKIGYNYDGVVRWAGAFGLAEYKGGNWSAFFNLSSTVSAYKRIDYFLKKDSLTNKYQETPTKIFPSVIAKGGANYNLTEHMNIYTNVGYFSRAPRFTNVFTTKNRILNGKNEQVYSAELGFNYTSRKVSFNINSYYTIWNNRPFDFVPTINYQGETYDLNIQSVNARHMGIEFDGAYKVRKNLTIEGMLSVADWIWTSQDSAFIQDQSGNILSRIAFDARGVKVSDAAQISAAGSVRYEPIKGLYFKAQYTYFGKNYAAFDPTNLYGDNAGRQSWKMPSYGLLDAYVGYGFNIKKIRMDLRGTVINVLNTIYISDATNNGTTTFGPNFDASSASVFVGMGRRFTTSLTITY